MKKHKNKGIMMEPLAMRDLKYLLFSKKNCPECGSKLEKSKVCEIRMGYECGVKFVKNTILNEDMEFKYYRYVFRCEKCGSQFPLKDLAKKEGDDTT